jgi:murein DD-endopeptidase MepM/ murein hydrolase activator NlpD
MKIKPKYFIIIGIIAVIALIVIIFYPRPDKDSTANVFDLTAAEVPEPKFEYGLNVDSIILVRDKIKRNQHLSDILLKYGVEYSTIDLLARRSKNIFDVRKIRYGNNYSMLLGNDSLQQAKYFVYEISPVDYVVFDLMDSVHAHRGEKEIRITVDTATGVIESSLWNAMADNQTDPNLANELSEIYAWTVDFFGIQKGDNFKVIYENLWVEDKRIGIGKVLASTFNHYGKNLHAFYFVQDSIGDYFDDEANSLRRTFLKAPLRYRRISSRFSYSRMHPILKYRRPHLGVDYAADRGTPVVSVGDGLILRASWDNGGGGRVVKIKHNGTYTTQYMHLSKYGKGIKKGVRVKQGQIIGYVGASGLATGPHLDFRFYRNGKPIDPLKVKSPAANPVDSANLQQFNIEKEHWLKILDGITIGDPDSGIVATEFTK